jgi:hypothetical protein
MPLGWIRLGCVAAASVVGLAAASAAEAASFDGTWSVLQVCDSTQEGARGYTWRYDAAVKDSHLVGHYRNPGQSPSLTLEGQINPDGTATLIAEGISAGLRPQYQVRATAEPHLVSRGRQVRSSGGRRQQARRSQLQVHLQQTVTRTEVERTCGVRGQRARTTRPAARSASRGVSSLPA